MRPYSCWCPACFSVAVEGPGKCTSLRCNFDVLYCTHTGNTLCSKRNKSCRTKTGAEACSPDKRARDRGHTLAAAGLSPDQWMLVEAFDDNDTSCGSRRLWISLISVANLAARSTRRDREMSTACALIPGISLLPSNCTSAFQKASGLSFFRVDQIIDAINSTELHAVSVNAREIGLFPAGGG